MSEFHRLIVWSWIVLVISYPSITTKFATSSAEEVLTADIRICWCGEAPSNGGTIFRTRPRKRLCGSGARRMGSTSAGPEPLAVGANMHDSAFRERRGMRPHESRSGRIRGYRLRFNLEGHPIGRAAPANICPDPQSEVWGVLYKITRRDLVHLDRTEGVPGRRYRHLWADAEDIKGRHLKAVTYIADGKDTDGHP